MPYQYPTGWTCAALLLIELETSPASAPRVGTRSGPPGSVLEAEVNKQPTADNSDFAGMYTSDLKQVSYMTTFTLIPLTDAGFVAVGS